MRALVLEEYKAPFRFSRDRTTRPPGGPGSGTDQSQRCKIHSTPRYAQELLGMAGPTASTTPAISRPRIAGSAFTTGDEVYGMTGDVGGLQGSLAEFAAVDAYLLARKPASLSMRESAAIPLIFITAWEGLVDRAGVRSGQTVLIQAGGVGHMACTLPKRTLP